MTNITLKKRAESASVPLAINLETKDGKVETYRYKIQALSTRDLLKLQMEMSENSGQEATQAASARLLKDIIEHITPEDGSPGFMALIEAVDVQQMETLLKAVTEAATKGSGEL